MGEWGGHARAHSHESRQSRGQMRGSNQRTSTREGDNKEEKKREGSNGEALPSGITGSHIEVSKKTRKCCITNPGTANSHTQTHRYAHMRTHIHAHRAKRERWETHGLDYVHV